MNSRDANPTILVISNFYPPHYLGGYELACADVVGFLRSRSWNVQVLTSRYKAEGTVPETGVERSLHVRLPGSAAPRPSSELIRSIGNRRTLRRSLARHRADVVVAFNLSGLGGLLLDLLHRQPLPVVHDVSDTSLASRFADDVWFDRIARPHPGSGRRLLRRTVRTVLRPVLPTAPAANDLGRSYFRSDFLRRHFLQAGFPVAAAPVIHHGIRAELLARPGYTAAGRGVAFSGRISPEKGVTILVRAMELASPRLPPEHRRLTIIGPVADPTYASELRRAVADAAGACRVELCGQMARDEALRTLPEHAVFALPAVWDEPFSIGLLEALALGMPVVATMTGGTPEVLEGGRNCLAVAPGDAETLADALVRLLGDEPLRRGLSAAARRSASLHVIDRAFEAIEAHLLRTLAVDPVHKRA